MDDRWSSLRDGQEYTFGLLQLDLANHSKWRGSESSKQKTKQNLRRYVSSIASLYEFKELSWPGDGGVFFTPIIDPSRDYDSIARCAIHIKESLIAFNSLTWLNLLDFNVELRISCHSTGIHYSQQHSELHGSGLNMFLKHERDIGAVGKVTLTSSFYEQLNDRDIKRKFGNIESSASPLLGISGFENIFSTDFSYLTYASCEVDWGSDRLISCIGKSKEIRIFASGSNSYFDLFQGIRNKYGDSFFDNLTKLFILIRKRDKYDVSTFKKVKEYLARWEELADSTNFQFYHKTYLFDPVMFRGFIFDEEIASLGFYYRKNLEPKKVTHWGSSTPLVTFPKSSPMFRYARDTFEHIWSDEGDRADG